MESTGRTSDPHEPVSASTEEPTASETAEAPRKKGIILQLPLLGPVLVIFPDDLQQQLNARTDPPTQEDLVQMLASYPGKLRAIPLRYGFSGSPLSSLLARSYGSSCLFGRRCGRCLGCMHEMLMVMDLVNEIYGLLDELLGGHGGRYGGGH
jgi:hypothetical protein